MKSLSSNLFKTQILVGVCMLLTLVSSCSKPTTFLTSTVVPAAEGTIRLKKDSNKNYVIMIKMSNLAEVERLQPPKKVYVVWMENEEGRAKNLGQINSTHELISKQLKASFETVSPFKPTKIYITAEDESNVNFPGSMVILQSRPIN
ncbi:hypothetical protein [Aquirufa ecclesiirivi]|uniref:hypothetical protein n=1 Tax=Aquirufa ecclesiirivi TaxID=2715124 RepID=UPI003BAF49A2